MSMVKVRRRSSASKSKFQPAVGLVPAAVYLRMSSDKQDKSIEEQRSVVLPWAEKEGYRVVAIYMDEGISGDDTRKRKQFRKMIEDAEEGKFQAILCWDQDRFGRFDSIEAGHWTYPLRESGVWLHTVAQGRIDWNDFSGRMIYTIHQEGKHQYLHDHSRNTTRGLATQAKKGAWCGGPPPLGYVVGISPDGEKRLALGEPEHVDLITHIFDLYDAGRSLRGISEELNLKFGRHPVTNKHWNYVGVRRILKNPSYTGAFVWPRVSKGKYHCVRDGEVSDDLGETGTVLRISDNHPRIISDDQFARTQERLSKNKTVTTPLKAGGFLFTGLLYCKHCGHRMSGTTESHDKNRRYICCGHHSSGNKICFANLVRENELLAEVLEVVERWSSSEQVQREFEDELTALREKLADGQSIDTVKKRIAELDALIDSSSERLLLIDESLVGTVVAKLNSFKAERDSLAQQLEVLTKSVEETCSEKLGPLLEAQGRALSIPQLLTQGDRLAVRSIFHELIERIDVDVSHEVKGRRKFYSLRSGTITFNHKLVNTPWASVTSFVKEFVKKHRENGGSTKRLPR